MKVHLLKENVKGGSHKGSLHLDPVAAADEAELYGTDSVEHQPLVVVETWEVAEVEYPPDQLMDIVLPGGVTLRRARKVS